MAVSVSPQVNIREPGQRLVVFVPGMLENVAEFARQVYVLAAAQQRRVMYLSIHQSEADMLTSSRLLATLTAITEGSFVAASAALLDEVDLTEALRRFTAPGDLVAWPQARLLAPASLEKELGISQCVLPEVRLSAPPALSGWVRGLVFWLVALAILAGFTFVEIMLDGMVKGALMQVVLLLLFALEVIVLYQWNRIFG